MQAPAAAGCTALEQSFDAARKAYDYGRSASKVMQMTGVHPFCIGWTVFDVWRTFSAKDGPSRWVIRRETADIRNRRIVRWADERGCPAVLDVLDAFNRIPIGFGVGTVRPQQRPVPPPPPNPPDGTGWVARVLGARQPDGSSATVSIASNTGALARWAGQDINALDQCWTEVPPL